LRNRNKKKTWRRGVKFFIILRLSDCNKKKHDDKKPNSLLSCL
jgi:hypothetical protein